MYKVLKTQSSSNGYKSYTIASFDNEKDALICEIENNWKCMAKYKNYKYNEDFQFNWGEYRRIFIGSEPCVSSIIPIPNEVLITYDVEKLKYMSKNQRYYFQEGSSFCYIEKDEEDDDEYKTCKICERGESIYNITGCCGICIDCAQNYTCGCKI